MEQTELKEILKRRGALHILNGVRFYTESSVLAAMKEVVEKLNSSVPTKEVWELACKQTLNDISKTFKENTHKGDTLSDRDIFQAVSETITSFPIPKIPITLSLPESKNVPSEEDFKKCKKLLVNRDEHLNAKIKECKEKDTRIQELECKLKEAVEIIKRAEN